MLRDVGDPQLVRAAAGEIALDAVGSDVVAPDPLPLTPSCDALHAGTPHQQLDLVVSDLDAAPESEFGMDPAGTVDPVALGVDMGDQVGEHRVPDSPF